MKIIRETFHVLLDVDEMVKSLIQNKSKKMIEARLTNNWSNTYIKGIIYGILAQVLVSEDI